MTTKTPGRHANHHRPDLPELSSSSDSSGRNTIYIIDSSYHYNTSCGNNGDEKSEK